MSVEVGASSSLPRSERTTARAASGRRPPRSPRSSRPTLGHQPALDGIRGLAVFAVVAYHVGQADNLGGLRAVSHGGFLGVSAFLTLSGFLITSLLILEFEHARYLSLGGFWSRRFRRLMPAALLTLIAVGLLTPLVGTASQLRDLPGQMWASLLYVANWFFIGTGSDYAATFSGAPSPLKHFWSLAVEEQCYFVLPFLVALGLRFGRGRRFLVTILTTIVIAATATAILQSGGHYANAVYMGTHTRIAELAIGGLLAVALAGRMTIRSRAARAATTIGAPIGLGLLVASWALTGLQSDWLYRGGLTVHAGVVALVIAGAVQPHNPVRRVLSVRPLRELGRYSYGIYLFHWPVVWWLTSARLHVIAPVAAVAQVALTLALAVASYHLLEQPVRSRKWLRGPIAVAAPVAGFVAVALIAWFMPAPDRSRIVAMSASKDPVIPTPVAAAPDQTAAPPPVRVMVVGDSFALSVGLGLERWAQTSGRIATLNTGLVGCGFGRGGMNRGIGLERAWDADCKSREERLVKQIELFQPDIVLCAGGMWDVTDRKLEGTTRWTHIGEPAYDTYLTGEFRHLTDVLAQGGAKVVWATAPDFHPVYNPQSFMGKGPYAEAQAGRSERYNAVLRAALEGRPDARIIDLAGWMNRFPGGEFSPDLRVDGVHFTDSSTDVVASQFLGPALVQIARE